MKTILKPIKLNDQGGNVSVLHQILAIFNFPVIPTEITLWTAGSNTLKQVRELQNVLGVRVSANAALMDEKTIIAIVEAITKKGLVSADHLFEASGEVKVIPNSNNPSKQNKQRLIALDVDLRGAAVYRSVNSLQDVLENQGFEYLGEAISNNKGLYKLQFFDWQYTRVEYKKADIVIYAVNEKDQIIGRSGLMHTSDNDKGFVRDLDIVITNQDKRSEYETLMEALQVFLKQNNVQLDEISRSIDQLDFTANELDIDRNKLQLITSATLVVNEESNLSHELPHELLYGIARQEITLAWGVLYKQTEQDLLNAINASAAANIIDENFNTDQAQEKLKKFVATVKAAAIKHLLDDTDDDGNNPLNDMLTISLSRKKQRLAYLKAVADFKGDDFDEFWTTHLPLQPEFRGNEALVAAVKITHQLTALTGNHLPLVKELQTKLKVNSAQALIDLSHDDWLNVIKKSGVPTFVNGKDADEKQLNYARSIQNQLNSSFPTLRIANMVKENQLGINKVSIAQGVNAFLAKHENFSYPHSRIDKFQQEITQESNSVNADPEEVKTELLKQQRVFQISTDPKVMSVLSKNNLDSAHKVAAIPRANFISTYAKALGDNKTALNVHQRAELISARVESIAIELQQYAGENATPQKIMSSSGKTETQAILISELPNYKNLFGSPDLCECQHCRSVYSPAAYLVELLRFLERSTPIKEAEEDEEFSPYDYLIARRPDLIELALSCENTNTLTPYIDLANEVMEYYVANESLNSYSGENTGDATADELRANPQFTNIKAYKILSDNDEVKSAKYPFTLPYHQPLDVIRTYSDYLNTSHYEVMQAINPEPNDTTKQHIAAESLQLSPEGYEILVDNTTEENKLLAYFGFDIQLDAVVKFEDLSSVQEFMQRSGINYTDLLELLKTNFINPNQSRLDFLEKTFSGASISNDLYAWLKAVSTDQATTNDDAIEEAIQTDISLESVKSWARVHFAEFQQVITLFEPTSKCNLDTTRLRVIESIYEDPDTFVLMANLEEKLVLGSSGIIVNQWSKNHRFIRLWRKTGWSIHETDLMLSSLGEEQIAASTIEKLESVLLLKTASKLSIQQLAVLWGEIDTYGNNSLYKKLFLNKAAQQIDDVFLADAQGNYLSDVSVKLMSHKSTILAAFRVTESELFTLLNKVQIDSESILNLQNLSAIYRYVILSKALKISVTDLCKLIELFDISPLSNSSTPSDTYKFYQLAVSTKDMKFKPATLDYVFTGNLPVDTKLGLKTENILIAGKTISDDIAIVEQSHPKNPNTTLTSEFVAGILSLSFQPEVASHFMEIVQGTAIFSREIETNLGVVIPDILKEKYSYIEGSGRLICKGNMLDSERLSLQNIPSVNQSFMNAIDELFNAPFHYINEAFKEVFDLPTNIVVVNEKLLDRPNVVPALSLESKLEFIYSTFLPMIKNRLKENVVINHVADLIGLSEAATRLLLSEHIEALVSNFSEQGFSATYFNNTNFDEPIANPPVKQVDKTIDFLWIKTPVEERNLPVSDSFSARWQAYISAPASGQYTLIVEVREPDESFSLYFDGDLLLEKETGNIDTKLEILVDINAAKLHLLTLEYVENSGSAGVKLYWKTATSAPEIIPAVVAYPADILDAFVENINTMHRAAIFISGFSLTESELNHFISNNEDFGGINFSEITPEQWIRIRNYTELRNSVPQTEALLTDLFSSTNQTIPLPGNEQQFLIDFIDNIHKATGWNKANIEALIVHFIPDAFNTANPPAIITVAEIVNRFKNEVLLSQFNNVMKLVNKTGLTVETIVKWGKTSTEFEALHATAQLIKNTVRAKYDEKAWLDIAGGLSDKIRLKQQQALISYLLVQTSIKEAAVTDADGLFEHLLIDVQMGACMDTSRIVQANAAIQLFVNRILLNLESDIPPDSIDTDRWRWMKNYRVWEANRKVFLYPENWLAPEWRNDRSEFFKDLESHLLQNDITERSVEQGLRNYLMSMNEVANLDVFGMHQENDDDGTLKFLHVFGRTHNLPYKYFYRRWNEFHKWSAWEKVQLDIRSVEDGEKSGVHLIPVVWKGRLYLFWPEFMEKAEAREVEGNLEDAGGRPASALEPKKYWEIRLAWSEYVDGSWESKQVSSGFTRTGVNVSDPYPGNSQRQEDLTPIQFQMVPNITENDTLEFEVSFGGFYMGFVFQIMDSQSSIKAGSAGLLRYPASIIRYKNEFSRLAGSSVLSISDYVYLKKSRSHKVLPINTNLVTVAKQKNFEIAFEKPFIYSALDNRTYFVRAAGFTVDWSDLKTMNPNNSIHTMLLANHSTTSTVSRIKANLSTFSNTAFGDSSSHMAEPIITKNLAFHTFHHPFSSKFVTRLNQGGVSKLMGSDTEDIDKQSSEILDPIKTDEGVTFKDEYDPNFSLVKPKLADLDTKRTFYQENICFDPLGANSLYNWELFFHAPLYIATRLSKNGKFEEAMKWFHYIFDPTTNEKSNSNDENETSRYWKVRPFKVEPKESLQDYFLKLNGETAGNDPEFEFTNAIKEWRNNPFDPHLVASNRPIAYMKHVVIKYIENLIEWGDSLFRQFTRESVYEAIQLYVIASHVLGKRPEFVPKRGQIKLQNYASLKDDLDDFGNALVKLENIFPYSSSVNASVSTPGSNLLGIGEALYFCLPANDKLLEHWDTVTDRLFKIRHCQDLDGVERGLALFAPVIDPAALIQAQSQGLSLGSILADLSSPPPIYRFGYLLQKANEFCNDVKSLGSSVLSAIEKKDGEELSRLRASQETDMLERVTAIRERQVLSAKASIESLLKSRETAELRLEHYNTQLLGNELITVPDLQTLDTSLTVNSQLPADTNITHIKSNVDMSLKDSKESGVSIISREADEMSQSYVSSKWQFRANLTDTIGSSFYILPEFEVASMPFGLGGSITTGGQSIGSSLSATAKAFSAYAASKSLDAQRAGKYTSFIRRTHDWTFQANLVIREIIQLDKQITSAEIQWQVAKKELQNHNKQIENAKQTELFLKDKFSNQELYQWMKDQLFAVYKQSYNLAFEMAKKAEKAYQYELGTENTNFIQYGYWDSSKQGLVAGEKLQLSLRQLENSFMDTNRRELELSKNISIAMLNPLALIELKETGKCHISLPEELFDLDFQGHYFRRIKAVSVSIPCITGPYTSVNCTLRLIKNLVRKNTLIPDEYVHNNDEGIPLDDDRFRASNVPSTSIATSSGQNDAGMFEFNFRDERYLPFEGAGVISDWQLELSTDKDLRQFDYDTISDIILHIKYTAKEGSDSFKNAAVTHLRDYFTNETKQPLTQLLNIKNEFPNEWHRFIHPNVQTQNKILKVIIGKQRLPFFTQGSKIEVGKIHVLIRSNFENHQIALLQNEGGSLMNIDLIKDPTFGDLFKAELTKDEFNLDIEREFILTLQGAEAGEEGKEIHDILFVLEYSAL